ncbi:hypothetical protein Dfri01_58870 [Dyadobacter frigoris]|uniref:hypothetical protein n=1 Tax=Dyadobacter frigoris TaxID=2576211 RepID=UPI0024A2E27C|nr:hypothetical protein [Dyadobacter frigoris]GLU56426.1 hypothetical protein Dfri01_58870 [Dyadobacter frigoris]
MATNTNLHQRYKEIFDNEIRFKKVHLWIEIKYYYSYELEDDVYDKITDFIESILDRSDIEALLYFIVEHIDHQNAYFYFLHKSIKNNNILIFNFLLDQNIDTDFDDLLQHSIRNHQIDFVEQLLNKVKNIDVFISSSNFYHSTFLSLSVKQNQFYNKEDYYYITNLLLKKGANPSIDLRTSSAKEYSNIFDDSIPVIISMVNQKEDPELLKIFLRYGVNIQYFNLKAFLQRNNFDSDVLDIFISNGYDVSFFFDDYQFGFKEDELIQQVERFLPDAPIEIIKPIVSKARIIGHHDIKLLYYSAMANRFDVVKLLVSLGANLGLN